MTTFPFNPTGQATFSFEPTLDGQQYQAIVTWNLFAQRYYLNLYTLSNVLVVALAIVGSPSGVQLQSLAWAKGKVTATTEAPHGYKTGKIVTLVIAGVTPDGYNGTFQCLITGPSTFTYALAANPGQATALGTATYNINLVGGYFTTSSLVYRAPANQFEVSP
jgi:hypothetical protein